MIAAPDLSRLTSAEREILTLLAEGHTAKTIAAHLGRSEGSINERLREARRKTGVGSSRELARLLRDQESRDEQMRMADPAALPSTIIDAPPVAHRRKALLMTLPFLTLTAAVALHMAGQQAAPQPPQTPVPPGSAPIESYEASARDTFRAEPREAGWADGAETALRRQYLAIDGVDANSLHIECRRTLCEVGGRLRPGIDPAAGKRAVDELGGPALRSSIAGLHADVTQSGSNGVGAGFHGEFTAFWRRTTT